MISELMGPAYYYLGATPLSVGLLYFNAINYIISHFEPWQANMSHNWQLHSMDPIPIRSEVIQCSFPELHCTTTISL